MCQSKCPASAPQFRRTEIADQSTGYVLSIQVFKTKPKIG